MKIPLAFIAMCAAMSSPVYGQSQADNRLSRDEKRAEAAALIGILVDVIRITSDERRGDRADRVYRLRGARSERRCFETRHFDSREGIIVSRYICQ